MSFNIIMKEAPELYKKSALKYAVKSVNEFPGAFTSRRIKAREELDYSTDNSPRESRSTIPN